MAVISRKRALGISDFVAELSAGMAEPFIFWLNGQMYS